MIKELLKYVLAVPLYILVSIVNPALLAWFVTFVALIQAIMATYQYIKFKSEQEKALAAVLNRYKGFTK